MAGASRDPASARRAAHAILSQPQFRQPPESIIDRARHWLGQQLANALDAVLRGDLTVIGAVVLIAVVALLVWMVVLAARRSGPTPRRFVVATVQRDPEDWLAEAEAFERGGAWREALRARYRAMVAELARRGLVDEIPGRTTGEYRAEVTRSLPGAAGDFGSATDLFELIVYGDHPAGPDDAARVRGLAERVMAGAR